jgi:hypothetical protein
MGVFVVLCGRGAQIRETEEKCKASNGAMKVRRVMLCSMVMWRWMCCLDAREVDAECCKVRRLAFRG